MGCHSAYIVPKESPPLVDVRNACQCDASKKKKKPVSLATSFLTGQPPPPPPLQTDMHSSNIRPSGPFETHVL